MKTASVPRIVQLFYPSVCWRKKCNQKTIYITFDDGPHPEITRQVLDILDEYNAKATFFCVGENVQRYPDVFDEVKNRGHSVGNHTFNHLKGWKTSHQDYIDNVHKCNDLVKSSLFRPPYGKISFRQIRTLKKDFQIVMWSLLSYDYDQEITPEQCFHFATKNAGSGSIIVFHDSVKASKNMIETLPKVLKYYADLGFSFCSL